MIFRDFAENLLGSRIKVKILTHLLREELPNSERELSRLLGVSNTAIHKAMLDFQDLNLVSPWVVGGANLWRLNTESYAYKVIAGTQIEGLTSLALLSKRPPLRHVRVRLAEELSHYEVKVYIFGSVAKGEEEAGSDIDVFVEVGTEEKKKAVIKGLDKLKDEFVRLFGNQLRPYVVSRKDLSQKAHAKIAAEARQGIMVTL